jgi:hypothetical protein
LTHFRMIEKRRTDVMIPVGLDDRLRAVRGRRSLSAIVSMALCHFLEVDPEDFGLDAEPAAREAPTAGVAPSPGSHRHSEARPAATPLDRRSRKKKGIAP